MSPVARESERSLGDTQSCDRARARRRAAGAPSAVPIALAFALLALAVLAWVIAAPAARAQAPTTRPALTETGARTEDRVLEVTPQTEAAIARALAWLAAQQRDDGSFQGAYGRNTGVCSFAVLGFMSTGTMPGRGTHGRVAARGIDYVLGQAQLSGLIVNPRDSSGKAMYEHGMSTLMLAEAWGMYDRPGLLDTLQRAVDLIVSCQNDAGGWRYDPRPADADVSVTVMQLVALRAAKNAGIRVPRRVFDMGVTYVKACAVPAGGFNYQPGVGGAAYARTGAGTCSLQVGGDYDSPEVVAGLRYLLDNRTPDRRGQEYPLYGLYYAAQATYLAKDAAVWREWYPSIREELLASQAPDGHWDGEAGSVYGTAMAVLALSVPCRYLPVYQH